MSLLINNLCKQFRSGRNLTTAVDNVNLEIKANTIMGLVGESGSGKSTLGKLIMGLHDKSSGRIQWQGEQLPKKYKPADFSRYSQDFQMIFQDPYGSLNPRMTAIQCIAEPLILSERKNKNSMNREQIFKKALEWLEHVGLSATMAERYPHEFSGGQRQRIGIARALITEPKLLICDEPITALDVSVQAQIINLLKHLQEELGMSMLFIAHDIAMVRYLCDEISVMNKGKIVEQGFSESLISNPQNDYTKMLLAAVPSNDPQKRSIGV